MNRKIIIIILISLAAAAVLTAAGRGGASDTYTGRLIEDIAPSALDKAEEEGILLMREEEKLARDVYLVLYEKWDLWAFSNIASSESTHMESMAVLIDRYDLKDPVQTDKPGVFTNPELQALYNDLTARGLKSLNDAVRVGIAVEELDIRDLKELIARTDNEDLKLVYDNLLRGSENHLRAFQRQLR